MALKSTQSAMQVLDVLQQATRKKQELRVSKNGTVRIATLWDKAKSSINSLFAHAEKAATWEKKAKESLIKKMTNDSNRSIKISTQEDREKIRNLINQAVRGLDNPDIVFYANLAIIKFQLNQEDADAVAEATKQIIGTDQKKTEEALNIAYVRLCKMKDIKKATPHGINLSLVDNHITEYETQLSPYGKSVYQDYLKNEKITETNQYGICDQLNKDLARQNFQIKIGNTMHTYFNSDLNSKLENLVNESVRNIDQPEQKEKMKDTLGEEIERIEKQSTLDAINTLVDNNPNIRFAISLVFNQSSANGLLFAALHDLKPTEMHPNFSILPGDPDDIEAYTYKKNNLLLTLRLTPQNNFIIETQSFLNYHTLLDASTRNEFPINRKGGDYALELTSKVEYERADLEKRIINPKVIDAKTIVRMALDWKQIDEDQTNIQGSI